MAVAADDEHARKQVSVFGQYHVADTLHVVEIRNAVAGHPFAGEVEDGGTFRVHRRDVVVGGDDGLFGVPHLGLEAFEDRRDAPGSSGIVHHGEIDRARDDVAGRDRVPAGGAGDDLFGEGPGHGHTPR